MGKIVDHSQRKHALLSASGSERWMACTPSARFEEEFPKQEYSPFAAEGTLAHEFGEIELKHFKGQLVDKAAEVARQPYRNNPLYTDEMEEQVAKYTDYVKDLVNSNEDAVLHVEVRVNLTEYIENGFGTSDAVVKTDTVLEVIDLKYGKGVVVEAEDNPQGKLYALGALHTLYADDLDIETIRITIVQPRLDSISSWDISRDELEAWGRNEVKTKALLAYDGKGEFQAGSHCKWCRGKAKCRALAEFSMDLAKLDFKNLDEEKHPNMLEDSELVDLYVHIKTIQEWLKSIGEFMLAEALAGKSWDGLKVVEGRANRAWIDETKVSEHLLDHLFIPNEIFNMKVKGIGEIEKLVGKKEFNDFMKGLVHKPEGKPSLVKSDVQKPEFGLASAKKDFT